MDHLQGEEVSLTASCGARTLRAERPVSMLPCGIFHNLTRGRPVDLMPLTAVAMM